MDTSVMASVLTWAEQVTGAPVALESAPEGGEGFMLLSIPGDIISRYKSGGHVATFPFSLVRRVNHADTDKRLESLKLLGDIAASIESKESWPVAPDGYLFQKMEALTLPARASFDDSGADDYQVTLALTYRKRG